jgi:deoxyribonuclease V
VWLSETLPGLGHYLYYELGEIYPVIGVAKNPFKGSVSAVQIYRGKSQKPLFITFIGIPKLRAAAFIKRMAGNNRLPDMIKQVDQLALSPAFFS